VPVVDDIAGVQHAGDLLEQRNGAWRVPGQMQDDQSSAAQLDPLTVLEPTGHRDRLHPVGPRVLPRVGQHLDHQIRERRPDIVGAQQLRKFRAVQAAGTPRVKTSTSAVCAPRSVNSWAPPTWSRCAWVSTTSGSRSNIEGTA